MILGSQDYGTKPFAVGLITQVGGKQLKVASIKSDRLASVQTLMRTNFVFSGLLFFGFLFFVFCEMLSILLRKYSYEEDVSKSCKTTGQSLYNI